MVTLDLIYNFHHFPGEGNESRITKSVVALGGPIGRGMLAAHRLGAKVKIIGMVGVGTFEELLITELDREGLLYNLERDESAEGSQHSVVLLAKDTASRTTFWVGQPRATHQCIDVAMREVPASQIVLLDCSDMELCLAVATRCRRHNIPTVLDTGSYKEGVSRVLALIDYVVVPEKFLLTATGMNSSDESEIERAAQKFSRQIGLRSLIVTQGAKGGFLIDSSLERVDRYLPHKVDAVDTCGAGDSFRGGLSAGLACGWPLLRAANFAAWVAACKCTTIGNLGLPNSNKAAIWQQGLNIPESS